MEPLIIVSADGHGSMPPELWEQYLEPEFHEHLPRLRAEQEMYNSTMWKVNNARQHSPEMVEMAEACVGLLAAPPDIDLLDGISAHDLA